MNLKRLRNFTIWCILNIKGKIQIWQSDNVREFSDGSFEEYISQLGKRHHTSYTYTPQQTGLAKRKNKQILEVVRDSLFGMNMPHFYWGKQ